MENTRQWGTSVKHVSNTWNTWQTRVTRGKHAASTWQYARIGSTRMYTTILATLAIIQNVEMCFDYM